MINGVEIHHALPSHWKMPVKDRVLMLVNLIQGLKNEYLPNGTGVKASTM